VAIKENGVVRFRKSGLANLTPEQLLSLALLAVSTRLDQVALGSKTVALAGFIGTKILSDV
jgi:hypothetical protein